MGLTFCPAACRSLKLCEAWRAGAEWVCEFHIRKAAKWFPEGMLPHYLWVTSEEKKTTGWPILTKERLTTSHCHSYHDSLGFGWEWGGMEKSMSLLERARISAGNEKSRRLWGGRENALAETIGWAALSWGMRNPTGGQ